MSGRYSLRKRHAQLRGTPAEPGSSIRWPMHEPNGFDYLLQMMLRRRAVAAWRKTQRHFVRRFGERDWERLRTTLERLEAQALET